MKRSRISRRAFGITTFAVAAGISLPGLIPARAMGDPSQPGANSRIRVGVIGTGDRAGNLLRESPPDLEFAALADCDLRQLAAFRAAGRSYPGKIAAACPQYQDYRSMLAKEKLDAVFVATTVHARALACIHAMQAGLDVYAEKPIVLTIEEGQRLVRAEQKYGRVFQAGTQQRSIPLNNFGSDLVRHGALGRVHTVICPNFVGPEPRPELPVESAPAEMNWDFWCHQTALISYSSRLHPGIFKWGPWRDYDGGGSRWGVTCWGVHAFDQIQRALGDDAMPEEAWPENDEHNCPVTLRYPGGVLVKLVLQKTGPRYGAIFVGQRGKIEINRNRLASNPKELIEGAPPPDDSRLKLPPSAAEYHIRNWIDCIRSRNKPNAHAAIGHRAHVICSLVNICRELKRRVKWDPVKEEFIGDGQANSLRSRPRRKGYELPAIG